MMIAVYVLVGLVALVVVLALVAYALGSAMDKHHVLKCAVTVRGATCEQVWDLCADVVNWPKWANVDNVKLTAGPDEWRMFMGRNVMSGSTRRVSRPSRLDITVVDEKMKIFEGVWEYTFTPAGDGCRVELVEKGQLNSAIPRFMARKLADPAMYLKRHLREIAANFGQKDAKLE